MKVQIEYRAKKRAEKKLKKGKGCVDYVLDCIQEGKTCPDEILSLALFYIIVKEKFDLLDTILKSDVNIHVDNDIAFITAAEYGHLKYVEYLFEKENIHNKDAVTKAVWNGKENVVEFFVENGIWDDEIVQLSINLGIVNIMRLFLNVDNNFLEKSYEALPYLSKYGDDFIDVIEFLLDNGVDIHYDNDFLIRQATFFKQPNLLNFLENYVN